MIRSRRTGVSAPFAAIDAALLLASCSAVKPSTAAPSAPTAAIQTVRFAADGAHLLQTACPERGDPLSAACAVLLVDARDGQAVRVAPPAGYSLGYPAWSRGEVIASLIALHPDAKGNRASAVVAFPPTGPSQARVVARSTKALTYPEPTPDGTYAWQVACRRVTEIDCQHDLVGINGGQVVAAAPFYGFRDAGRIAAVGARPVVAAGIPEAAIVNGTGYVEWVNGSSVWAMVPSAPFGMQRLSPTLFVLAAAPAPGGDLILMAGGNGGSGLYRRSGTDVRQFARLPDTIALDGARGIDIDVSPDGGTVALRIGHDQPRVVLYDIAKAAWRDMPETHVTTNHTLAVPEARQ